MQDMERKAYEKGRGREMRSLTVRVIIFLSLGLLGSPALSAGDSAEGHKLAKEHCARCHDVEPGGAFKEYPPSFAAIAVYRSEPHIRALILYPTLHSAMPEVPLYLLGSESLDDLVAYITSLEE
jgi:mono/diheme cytochrome c family protein